MTDLQSALIQALLNVQTQIPGLYPECLIDICGTATPGQLHIFIVCNTDHWRRYAGDIFIEHAYATLHVVGGRATTFEYCDPTFPDNLIRYIANVSRKRIVNIPPSLWQRQIL